MSERQTRLVVMLLAIGGFVLLVVALALIAAMAWCVGSLSPLAAKVCGEGSLANVAVALLAATAALLGAAKLRGTLP